MKTSAYVGIEPPRTNKLDQNDTTTLSNHPYILCDCVNYALC